MDLMSFDSISEIMRAKDSWRKSKLCQKIDKFNKEDKYTYFTRIIEEWAYNQTSNLPKNSQISTNKKQIRKKTKEELKLLEYFLEQDPKWSRKTISTASRVLGMSTYQVYKWGYDRRNKKEGKCRPQFLKELEITNSMIEKINKFDTEIKGEKDLDLNKQVNELLNSTGKYKNNSSYWTEIPIGELSLHKNQENKSILDIDPDFSPFDDDSKAINGPFKVIKVPRKRKMAAKSGCKLLPSLSTLFNYENFNQWTEYQKFKCQKINEKDMIERYSDTTVEKSIVSSTPQVEEVDAVAAKTEQTKFPQ